MDIGSQMRTVRKQIYRSNLTLTHPLAHQIAPPSALTSLVPVLFRRSLSALSPFMSTQTISWLGRTTHCVHLLHCHNTPIRSTSSTGSPLSLDVKSVDHGLSFHLRADISIGSIQSESLLVNIENNAGEIICLLHYDVFILIRYL
jgi:hypothetical protein